MSLPLLCELFSHSPSVISSDWDVDRLVLGRWLSELIACCPSVRSGSLRMHVKPGTDGYACNPFAPAGRWEAELAESTKTQGPTSLAQTTVNNTDLISTKVGNSLFVLWLNKHACIQRHIHVYSLCAGMYIYTHLKTKERQWNSKIRWPLWVLSCHWQKVCDPFFFLAPSVSTVFWMCSCWNLMLNNIKRYKIIGG